MSNLNKVYSIAVDIKNVEGKYSSYAKFFDDDRDTSIIKIKLLNNNYPIDLEGCTVEAQFILANNTYHDETCKIINTSEGIVELQLCQECLVAGKNTVRLSILKENEIANTPVITYEVKKGLYSDNPNFNDDPLTPVLSQMLLDVKVTKANQIELQERYEQSFPRIELKIKEVDEKIKEVNLAIASGTQDLEVKEARANKKGIVYAKLGDRLDEVDSQLEQNIKQVFASSFGVIADGVTDDTIALQTAIDKAREISLINNSKVSVILPKGTIVISNANSQYKNYQSLGIIRTYSNITIQGQGIGETIITKPANERDLNGISMIYNTGCKDGYGYSEKNISFKDFTITEGEAEPIHVNGSVITIGHCENLTFERVQGLNFDQHLGDIMSCKNVHIRECHVYNNSPSQKAGSFQFDWSSTMLNYNHDNTITRDIFIYNNNFEHTNTGTGHLHFHICEEFENIYIFNNYFKGKAGIVIDNKLEVRNLFIYSNLFDVDETALGLCGIINGQIYSNIINSKSYGIKIGGNNKYNGNPINNADISICNNIINADTQGINTSYTENININSNTIKSRICVSGIPKKCTISNNIVHTSYKFSEATGGNLDNEVEYIVDGNKIYLELNDDDLVTKAYNMFDYGNIFKVYICNNNIDLNVINMKYKANTLIYTRDVVNLTVTNNVVSIENESATGTLRYMYLETYGEFVNRDINPYLYLCNNTIKGEGFEGISYASSKAEFTTRLQGLVSNNKLGFNSYSLPMEKLSDLTNEQPRWFDFGINSIEGNNNVLQVEKNTRYQIGKVPKNGKIYFNTSSSINTTNNIEIIESVDSSLNYVGIKTDGSYVYTGNLGITYTVSHGTRKGTLVESGYISILIPSF